MQRAKRVAGIILCILLTLAAIGCGGQDSQIGKEGNFIKAAWYFGENWPLNFWNSEWDHLDEDLDAIADDGFNTIMLVVPWGEFQTGINPIRYNDTAMERLDRIIQKCDDFNLDVILRIGYYWDFDPDDQYPLLERYAGLISDKEFFLPAWEDYVKTIKEVDEKYTNVIGSLICWEDFWGIYYKYANLSTEREENKKTAQQIGYTEYLKNHYSLEEISVYYGENFRDYDEIYLPQTKDYAMVLFNTFFDDFLLNRILIPSQKIYPELSMEVRTDADVIYKPDGETDWFFHTDTFTAGDADYVASIYGIPMGFENNGERVSAKEALKQFDYIMEHIKEGTQGKPLFIDQFIFVDNTPGFEHNAQVKPDELESFLLGSADVLVNDTCGYALWTYRNYKMNDLYNSQFAFKDKGWQISGDYKFEETDGNTKLYAEQGTQLTQNNVRYGVFAQKEYTLSMDVEPLEGAAKLKVSINGENFTLDVEQNGTYELPLGLLNEKALTISIEEGAVYIDNVNLYYAVQEGEVYDEDMNALRLADDIRTLNERIDQLLEKRTD